MPIPTPDDVSEEAVTTLIEQMETLFETMTEVERYRTLRGLRDDVTTRLDDITDELMSGGDDDDADTDDREGA